MSDFWREITSESELHGLLSGGELASSYNVILKHSRRCMLSGMAKNRLERQIDDRINYFLIDVIGHREVSNALEVASGIRHESPQMFIYNGSLLLDVKSHMAIDPQEISKRLDSLVRI